MNIFCSYLPNSLSILRIALSPWIFYLFLTHQYMLACIVFIIAVLSDLFDGLLARYLKCESSWGKILDPIADKVLMISFFAACTIIGKIPWWLLFIMILRDVLIMAGASHLMKIGHKLKPLFISKCNTMAQSILGLIILISFFWNVPHIIMFYMTWILISTTTLSTMAYIYYFYSIKKT